jgi:tRNA(Ile)-lysidine synthase
VTKASHPPTLITLVKRAFRDEIALPRGARILVATSGGPDSMALLDVLAGLRRTLSFELVAHGVDHGLRANAAAELDLAEAHATSLAVAFSRSQLNVASGSNVQARAREARYAALEAARKRSKAQLIATAHHGGDRAETVLMRILRGAGPSGLAVLPARHGRLIRPLIRAGRRDVELHLERHRIASASDPSNADPRYLRTRIRMEVLPLLASLDPAVTTHLCALADDLEQFRDADESLYRIPRAARLALARLAQSSNARRTMRVLLPQGLEVTRRNERTRPKKR